MPMLVYADRQQHEMETFGGGYVRPTQNSRAVHCTQA